MQQVLDVHPRGARLDVDLVLDLGIERRVHGGRHGVEDPPGGLRLVGLATVEEGDKRLPLVSVRAGVDDGLHFAITLVHRPGPRVGDGIAEAG